MQYWVEIVVGLLTGVAGWIAGTKMRKVEVTGGEYENYQKFVDTTRTIIRDLREQVEGLVAQNAELRTKVSELEVEIDTLKKTYPCNDCPINGQ